MQPTVYRALTLMILVLALTACGDPHATPTTVPPTATLSPTTRPTAPAPTTTEATASRPAAQVTSAIAPAPTAAPVSSTIPATSTAAISAKPAAPPTIQEYAVPKESGPHDVAPAPDGTVWYTGQQSGELGRLNPTTGEIQRVKLGAGSAPHGVIIGPDGAPWVTDGGLNAIVRVDPTTLEVKRFLLPANRRNANLNTATFDTRGLLWFTGQNGIYGRLDPKSGEMTVFDAPRGPGPYGINITPDGAVYYASLAGNYLGRIDAQTGAATALDPPTQQQGTRRVWPDSRGRLWVSEWNVGQVGMYDPATNQWKEWKLPGAQMPLTYAVYVDNRDMVWLTDFGNNAIVRFDPAREAFDVFPLPTAQAYVRQLLGRPGEVWGAESGADKLVVIRSA